MVAVKQQFVAVALVATALFAGACSSASDVDTAASTATAAIPRWIRVGVDLAKAEKNDPLSTRSSSKAVATASSNGLPSEEGVVAALTAQGMTEGQAKCVYKNVSINPTVAKDVATLLKATGALAASAANPPAAKGTITPLSGLDPDTGSRLAIAIAPCFDAASLVSLLGASGALGSDAASLAALLTASGDVGGVDAATAATLAQLSGSKLDPAQLKQLQALLAAAATSGNATAALAGIDLAKLDLAKLTPAQIPILAAAIIRGLTGPQQQQLFDLSKVNFDKLGIKIDPDKLTSEQVGALLLAASPLLAASVSPTNGAAPAGVNPNQIYIPAGLDLSQINPLMFVARESFVSGFVEQGQSGPLSGCLYDKLRVIPPTTLAALFTSNGTPLAASEVLVAVVSCIVDPTSNK